MKKSKKLLYKALIFLTGKAIMLCGVAFTTTTCVTKYGPGPDPVPDYWSDQAPELTNNDQQYEQTPNHYPQNSSKECR